MKEAQHLTAELGFPDVEALLVDLNNMRKHQAYADTEPPDGLDSQDVASEIENYVEEVRKLLAP